MKHLTSKELREKFLQFFKKHHHTIVASSPLIPQMDPTLLFTNAGMNQFKGVFIGQEKRNYNRAVSAQKCVRAGGKHNDLENVGRTNRHHTFFEMLGNFSFGDYFKKEAIQFAWDLITKEFKLPTDRLVVSVFQDDDEAYEIWKNDIGVKSDRIFRFGEKDNFWAMGDTGPCGPCSEIFFDLDPKKSESSEFDEDRFLEFWNLVFMEFDQKPDGARVRLPKPSIDTGLGLERMTAIMQGVESNYDTDLFEPILKDISKLCAHDYWKTSSEEAKVSMRVIADHIRAMTFLISDGVYPSKEGRGYVLRRIMRRAMRHGKNLELKDFGLSKLSSSVIKLMGGHYSDLKKNSKVISSAIHQEEERFSKTVDRGLSLLAEEISQLKNNQKTTLAGDVAFHLYDTYGFPVDLTDDILGEQNLTLDQTGFYEAFERHREKARGSWKGSGKGAMYVLIAANKRATGFKNRFVGYEQLSCESVIKEILEKCNPKSSAKKGDEIEILVDETPFYGESGGQVGDIGSISGPGFSISVLDTQKYSTDLFFHQCRVEEGKVKKGDQAILSVDEKARKATAKNHTATHLLHSTLKEILGPHVAQKGSLVAPERLRFDFTHPNALTDSEVASIEQKMNERIWINTTVQIEEMDKEKALASGAVALFDEKYGTKVRVISVGDYSKELCGGTHLARTGEIGLFKIVKEGGVSTGIRRLEAYTGYRALRYVYDLEQKLKNLSSRLGTSVEHVEERIDKLVAQQKEWKKKGGKAASTDVQAAEVSEINGIKFVKALVVDVDHRDLRSVADRELEKIQSGVVVIGTKGNGKAYLVVKVSKDLSKKLNAGKLIQPAAKLLGGSGGGRSDMAQAGGPEISQLKDAINVVGTYLK